MSNTVEIVVEGKNQATKVFAGVEKDAVDSARKSEQAWTRAADSIDSSIRRGGLGATEAGGGLNRLKQSAQEAGDEVERMGHRSSDSGDRLNRLGEASDNLDTRAMGFRDTVTGVSDTLRGLNDATLSTEQRLLMLGMGIGDLGSAGYNLLVPAFQKINSVFSAAGEGATGVASKFGSIGMVAGPLGAILAGGALVLGAWGAAQAKAAQYVEAHKQNVTALTDAIRADAGVLGAATHATNAKALADKNAASNLAAFGVSIDTATQAIYGNSKSYDALKQASVTTLTAIADSSGMVAEHRKEFINLGVTALAAGKNYDQLKSSVLEAGKTYDSSGESAQLLTNAQQRQVEQMLNGLGAVGEQIRAQRDAHDSYINSEQALTLLSRSQIEARDATVAHTTAIYDQVNASLGLRGAQQSSADALRDYNEALKGGKENEKADALLRLEQAWQGELSAIQKSTIEHSTAATEASKTAEGLAAMNRRAVEMADSFRGPVPASLAETIAKMSATEARAAGLSTSIDATGAAVYRLPNGKFINVNTNAGAVQGSIEALYSEIQSLPSYKKITIEEFRRYITQYSSGTGYGARPGPGYAHGGPIGHAAEGGARSGLTWVGEQGPELVKLPVGSFVNSAGASSRGGSSGGGAAPTQITVSIDISGGDRQLMDWLRNRIRIDGGGDVQSALGQR